MMERHSKEVVDEALKRVDANLELTWTLEGFRRNADILAVEVRALRQELVELRGAYDVLLRGEAYQAACSLLNASIGREVDLRSTIARVEAFAEQDAEWSSGVGREPLLDYARMRLRAALKGGK